MSKETIDGIANGVFAFLHDRPVSVIDPAIKQISEAVAKSFSEWLDNHEDEIISAIIKARDGK
tara:strand:- start:27794 stop:27982 length:189 start_codon:yes stop_codon:yes gene_type:complete